MEYEMKNLTYSIWDSNDELSNHVKDVFHLDPFVDDLQYLECFQGGIFPFVCQYGFVGKVRFVGGYLDVEHLDKQVPKRFSKTNDHVFLEGMTMNEYGLITLWMGS